MAVLLRLPGIIGQEDVIDRLRSFASLYWSQGGRLPHVLLIGRDGYGKRAIARAFAKLHQRSLVEIEADSIESVQDLETIIARLGFRWLLLVDIDVTAPKMIKPIRMALEKFELEIAVKFGRRHSRKEKRMLTPFTCIATTSSEADSNPAMLRAFGQNRFHLHKYTEPELQRIAMEAEAHERADSPANPRPLGLSRQRQMGARAG